MKRPTEGELHILRLLWDVGPSTVRTVHEKLNEGKAPDQQVGYTTTLKLMQIMHEKGFLARKKSGRMHVYQALISEDDTQKALLNRMLNNVFQGSALKLIMQALGGNATSKEEIAQIRAFLNQLEQESHHQEGGST